MYRKNQCHQENKDTVEAMLLLVVMNSIMIVCDGSCYVDEEYSGPPKQSKPCLCRRGVSYILLDGKEKKNQFYERDDDQAQAKEKNQMIKTESDNYLLIII